MLLSTAETVVLAMDQLTIKSRSVHLWGTKIALRNLRSLQCRQKLVALEVDSPTPCCRGNKGMEMKMVLSGNLDLREWSKD